MLSEWSEFLHRIREFFIKRGYLEVHTPILLPYPNIDPHVEPMELKVKECGKERKLWLQTSPEFSMKKLLSKHRRDIFQIAKVFRNGECGKLHRLEFTMLEWYKLGVDYQHIIQEIGELISYLGLAEGYRVTRLEHAFEEHAGVVLSEEEEVFKNNLLAYGYEFDDREDWESLFFRVYIEVERKLGLREPEFITHFPERLSSYAKVEKGYAERFELYIRGVEIANGWTEETDPQEIRRRMEVFRAGRDLPIDEELFMAYQNFPPCAGCSIGLERLFMVYMGLESLEELYF
ncbi:MAG: elongation factor P--(R)-beta-lysine ligase [Aquificaceae bacterium]